MMWAMSLVLHQFLTMAVHALESQGDIWGNNNYDDASNAHDGANLVPPDFDGNEGVQPTPNITPAPEGAHRRTRGKVKEYPPAVWRRGADGNNMFALTFGQQEIPPMARKMSKKRQRLNHKQYRRSIKRYGDMAFNVFDIRQNNSNCG